MVLHVSGVGGTSSVVVYTAAGTPRTGTGALNITAAGGASGGSYGNSQGTPLGNSGYSLEIVVAHGSASEHPFTNAAGQVVLEQVVEFLLLVEVEFTNPNSSNSGGSGGGAWCL